MSGKPKEDRVARDFTEQEGVDHSLHHMDASLRAMATVPAVPLSHYRVIPDATKEAFEIINQGASLIHGTSTKYTLLGKFDTVEQTKMSKDLQKGVELVATGCLVLHEKTTGSSLSLRKHVIQASRGIVATTMNLIEAYTQGEAFANPELGAQKTGAVWQMCAAVLEKKIPIGNRNAMRRDLFTYTAECQETMDEFQELVDQGPANQHDNDEPNSRAQAEAETDAADDAWEDFVGGQNEQYSTPKELAVAEAALSILKISRGTIKLTVQALDAVGDKLNESTSSSASEEKPSAHIAEDRARLEWIRILHEECCAIGEGVTDLGTALYPPLIYSDVSNQLSRQMASLEKVIDHVLDASITIAQEEDDNNAEEASSSRMVPLDLHIDVSGMAGKLKTALTRRKQEVCDALSAVECALDPIE